MIGEDVYGQCKSELEAHYGHEISNLREYFTLTDAMVAEMH